MVDTPTNPAPEEIKAARRECGLTQTEAAKIVYHTLRAWQEWEGGRYPMHPAIWELFLIKTDYGKT